MTSRDRRISAIFPLLTIAAIMPTVWLTATASAEERKLAVLLAYPIKQDDGATGQSGLPNTNDIFDAYFDKFKNGQTLPNGTTPRIDSHAEWWEEISYGDVTVSGDVYGWVNLPWPTLPVSPGDLGPSAVPVGSVPHVDMIGGTGSYVAGEGEGFNNAAAKFRYDFDGVGASPFLGNFDNESGPNADMPASGAPRIQPSGSNAIDPYNNLVFTPGERFIDLNNNRIYDAGVFEWGIDKNGDGMITGDSAASYAELFGAVVQYPRDENGEPFIDDPNGGMMPDPDDPDCMNDPNSPDCDMIPIQIPNPDYEPELELGVVGWTSSAEWFDSNGDGEWDKDGFGSVHFAPTSEDWPVFDPNSPQCMTGECLGEPGFATVTFMRGDWSATEIWIDANNNREAGGRAVQDDRVRGDGNADTTQPPFILEFIVQVNDPASDQVEYYDEQWNNNFDFPEPFEDHLRRWDAGAHQFIRVDDDYILNNYPGDSAAVTSLLGDSLAVPPVVGRIGNRRYDAPDSWSNNGRTNSSNKLQEVSQDLVDGAENAERIRRGTLSTPEPSTYPNSGWDFSAFWIEWFGEWMGMDAMGNPEPPVPDWDSEVRYLRKFNPTVPVPPPAAEPDRQFIFRGTNGGPFNSGVIFGLSGRVYNEGDGTVLPNPNDGRDGWYDGPAEYVDLPSSIYHSAGDGHFGEITGPGSDDYFGSDLGGHNPNDGGGVADQEIPAAGPLAFNVHGDQGWDGGNVMNTEFLTWRTDGNHLTDDTSLLVVDEDDLDMDGDTTDMIGPVAYHRDVNLDGMIDLGETIGVLGEFGVPDQTKLHSYGMGPVTGQPANGDPTNLYPFNRTRAMEDTVEALDDVVDWDDFLGGPGPFGNSVYGLILMPSGTGPGGMFTLPASVGPGGFFVRTRDRMNENEIGIERYVPISFFDGMGIEIGGLGEGGGLEPTSFQNGFAGHEYGHIWESWPDLYDYDVRLPPPLNIENNPIGAWCVMAGGGLVHPVPILKASSGWIEPIDITRTVNPGEPGVVNFRPWEFDRDKTVFNFANPLFPNEKYWFWATGTSKPDPQRVNFDVFGPPADPTHGLPGLGFMVMRSDVGSNDEGLPPQQRIADGRFTYQIIQADGEQRLENGENAGDAGDPFPGIANQTQFTRQTDPAAVWGGSGEGTGLEITNIVRLPDDSMDITINWSPRELPTLEWIQPPPFGQPGPTGISVNGNYQLRYFSYDQFGGTTMNFYAQEFISGQPLRYDDQNITGPIQDGPGEVTSATNFSVANLPDGTYTFYAALMPGIGDDGRVESAFSAPRAAVNNFGDGVMDALNVDTSVSFFERWNVVCINDQPPGQETWQVTGTISGQQANIATTGQVYMSDPVDGNASRISFRIDSRVLPFDVGDEFIFVTTGRTPHSSAVLVREGEVVVPETPVANARIVSGGESGLAPHTVTFKHDQSNDPLGAALNFIWDFGDGSLPFETTDLDEIVEHTYTQPRTIPYEAKLTVVNIFGLSSEFIIPITVSAAQAPEVRIDASPRSGEAPLEVTFDAGQTSDPNVGTERLDFVWDFGDGSAISTAERVTHAYDEPGIYVARLTVTNRPYNISASRSIEIRVGGSVDSNLPPIAEISVDRTLGRAPFEVAFNADRSIDPEGGLLNYTWDFGDGSPIIRGVSSTTHTYQTSGDFEVTLTVEDPLGQIDTDTIRISVTGDSTINGAPIARISTPSRQGSAPFTATFDASASRDPEDGSDLRYEWDFDDPESGADNSADGVLVRHTFDKPQAYNVVLRVFDSEGASGAATVRILVNATAGQSQSGQDTPDGGEDGGDDIMTPACGAGCGPVGMMPMAFMLIGVGGLRVGVRRRFR